MIDIKETNYNGKTYYNVSLLTKYKKNGKLVAFENGKPIVLQQGLEVGEEIILEKTFVSGIEKPSKFNNSKPYYAVTAKWNDKEISFFLNYYQHEKFKNAGGEGDKVKVKCISVLDQISMGQKPELEFSKVE